MKSLRNSATTIAVTSIILLIGFQSALAATGSTTPPSCAYDPEAEPTITISPDTAKCTAGNTVWGIGAEGDYTCPCGKNNKPSHASIRCSAYNESTKNIVASAPGTSAYPGQWDCDFLATGITPGFFNTAIIVNVQCTDDSGNDMGDISIEQPLTCPSIYF